MTLWTSRTVSLHWWIALEDDLEPPFMRNNNPAAGSRPSIEPIGQAEERPVKRRWFSAGEQPSRWSNGSQ